MISDYVSYFYELMKIEFKRAGRTDYEECMNDLLKGDDVRFMREFGVKLPNIKEYKLIMKGNLPNKLKGIFQQSYFAEWVRLMKYKRNWGLFNKRGGNMDDKIDACSLSYKQMEKAFKKALEKKCKNCGAVLPSYPFYTEDYEIYRCKKCGMEYKRERLNYKINNC